MAPETGLEPVTYRLTAGRSTIELLGNILAELGGFEPLSTAVTGPRANR